MRKMAIFTTVLGVVWSISSAVMAQQPAPAVNAARPLLLDPPELAAPADARLPFGFHARRADDGLDIPGFGPVRNLYYYEVTAPGRVAPERYSNQQMPPTIAADRGRTIGVDLTSSLAMETNLHFHGFQGSAKAVRDRFGDCVLAGLDGDPGSPSRHIAKAVSTAVDPCSEMQPAAMANTPRGGSLRYSYVLRSSRVAPLHPRGLYWYHAHPHGRSENQIAGGLSGLIVVGDPRLDYKAQLARLDPASIRARVLGLKDMKLVRNATSESYRYLEFDDKSQDAYKNLACTTDNGNAGLAFCALDIKAPGDIGGAGDGRWLFTVNGMAYPQVRIGRGQTEIWRIANMSPDVSYRLQLAGDDGTLLRMQLLDRDGVAPATMGGDDRWTTELVLMPSARAELLINFCAATDATIRLAGPCQAPRERDYHAVLRTAGVATGRTLPPGSKDEPPGDQWPPMGLLDVVFEAAPRAAIATAPAVIPVKAALAAPVAPSAPLSAAAAAPCMPPSDAYMREAVRTIRLKNYSKVASGAAAAGETKTEIFGIASSTRRVGQATARQVLEADLEQVDDAAYVEFRIGMLPVCVQQGRKERWLIVNDSKECHNFHIHQLRFGVLGYRLDGTEPARAPNAQCLGASHAGEAGKTVLARNTRPMHDNFPLPPGARLLIELDFSRPDTVGRYVFHCHILEHEDKGMMSLIEVVPNGADVSGSARSQAAGRDAALARPVTAARFTLTDQDGAPFDSRRLAGRPHAIFFGYTNCPSICPTTLLDISHLLAGLGDDAGRLDVLFVSVDPAHDTAQHLHRYLSAFDRRIVGLTGDPVEIAAAAHAYKAFYEPVAGTSGPVLFDHSASVFLVDRSGRVVDKLSYQQSAAEQLAKLRRLIASGATAAR